MQSVEFALVQTVAANHAARIIDSTVLEIDGLGFAVFFAHTTILALVLIEADAEQRVARA